MVTYFKYEKKQRVVALTILANAFLLLLMYFAVARFLPETKAARELIDVATIAIWPIEGIFVLLTVYFWIKNKSFKLEVSSSELYYHDPTFGDVTYHIPINEITALEQFTNTQQTGTTNLLILKDGKTIELMYGNFRIDRKAFFSALKKANPKIVVPDSPYRYKVTRPSWAKRLLGRKDD